MAGLALASAGHQGHGGQTVPTKPSLAVYARRPGLAGRQPVWGGDQAARAAALGGAQGPKGL